MRAVSFAFRSIRALSSTGSRPLRNLPTSHPHVHPRIQHLPSHSIRHSSSLPSATSKPTQQSQPSHESTRPPPPSYELTFTCKPCSTRSTHRISKQGYHHGSVLITCPSCRNRHVISDHLNIFGERNITVEDLMKEQGQLVKKGTLSEDGDLEFWDDGGVSKRGEGIEGKMEGEEAGWLGGQDSAQELKSRGDGVREGEWKERQLAFKAWEEKNREREREKAERERLAREEWKNDGIL